MDAIKFVGLPYQRQIKLRRNKAVVNSDSELDYKLNNILQTISEYLGVEVSKIRGKSRIQAHKEARFYYCYLAREYTRASLTLIGFKVGRDHSTVIHSFNRVSEWRIYDKKVEKELQEIAALIDV